MTARSETRTRTSTAVMALRAVLALDSDVLTPREVRDLNTAIATLEDLWDGDGR